MSDGEPTPEPAADTAASAAGPAGDAAPDATDAPGDNAEGGADFEGPRRRARRERAERRALTEKAREIETARLEAKRKVHQASTEQVRGPSRGVVRGLKVMVWGVLVTLLVIGVGVVLYLTPLLSVRDIVVIGTGEVTREQVLETAAVPIGTPLLQVDTDAVAARVAGIRQVASARVQREYPSALRITVAERIPVATRDFPDGPRVYDRDGVDFVLAAPPVHLPYLDVDNPGPNDPSTMAALQVLTALRPEIAGQVGRVAAASVASVTLTLTDGRVVIWGTTDRTPEKAGKLAALLTQPGQTYDVSSPDLPTVK